MERGNGSNFVSAAAMVAGAWGILCALILAAPFFASNGWTEFARILYFCFSPVCHQAPERSFAVLGFTLAVCHRCCGIYSGFLLGSIFRNPWIHRSVDIRRRWIISAAALLAFDALIPFSGFWSNTAISRFATGFLFGVAAAPLLVRGIEEFLNEAPWQRCASGVAHFKRGLL